MKVWIKSSLKEWQQALPLTRLVIIIALNVASGFVVANVVESFKAGARDAFDSMIWDEEMFLPAHEEDILVLQVALDRVLFKSVLDRHVRVKALLQDFGA
jgi:hypothetical protein